MKFTEEEMEIARAICKEFFSLSEKARREGLLALDDDLGEGIVSSSIGGKYGEFAKILLKNVVDGIDLSDIQQIGKTIASSSELSDGDNALFEMIICGVSSIQVGDNPRILAQKLAAFTGIENFNSFLTDLGANDY